MTVRAPAFSGWCACASGRSIRHLLLQLIPEADEARLAGYGYPRFREECFLCGAGNELFTLVTDQGCGGRARTWNGLSQQLLTLPSYWHGMLVLKMSFHPVPLAALLRTTAKLGMAEVQRLLDERAWLMPLS